MSMSLFQLRLGAFDDAILLPGVTMALRSVDFLPGCVGNVF